MTFEILSEIHPRFAVLIRHEFNLAEEDEWWVVQVRDKRYYIAGPFPDSLTATAAALECRTIRDLTERLTS